MNEKGPVSHYSAYKCWGANEENLRNPSFLKSFLYKIASYCKSQPIDFFYKQFEKGGQGITAILIVEESFIVVETWPEYQHFYVAARLCGNHINIKGVGQAIKEDFPKIKDIKRCEEQEK